MTDILERLEDAKQEAVFDTRVQEAFLALLQDAADEIADLRAMREADAEVTWSYRAEMERLAQVVIDKDAYIATLVVREIKPLRAALKLAEEALTAFGEAEEVLKPIRTALCTAAQDV